MPIEIKKYCPAEDRDFIRTLACDTAFSGEPVEKFFDGREIIADILTLYYTEYEKESIFIAEVEGKKAGYLIGCKNIRRYKRILITKILPFLLLKSLIKPRLIYRKKTYFFSLTVLYHFLKKSFSSLTFQMSIPLHCT